MPVKAMTAKALSKETLQGNPSRISDKENPAKNRTRQKSAGKSRQEKSQQDKS
jgi:hypothetical protein